MQFGAWLVHSARTADAEFLTPSRPFEPLMPLTRPIGNPPLASPNGVQFSLADRSKIIRCLITPAALEKLAHHQLAVDQFDQIFLNYRDKIEAAASAKYDASPVLRTPFTITPADLFTGV